MQGERAQPLFKQPISACGYPLSNQTDGKQAINISCQCTGRNGFLSKRNCGLMLKHEGHCFLDDLASVKDALPTNC